MKLSFLYLKHLVLLYFVGIFRMAGSVQEAKNTLRQQIKLRLSQISIAEKVLQSNYVTSKVSKKIEYIVRFKSLTVRYCRLSIIANT